MYTADQVNPNFGSDHRVFDPLDFIAETVQHIPDAYRNQTIFYGAYSPRTVGERKKKKLRAAQGAAGVSPANAERPDLHPEPESPFVRRRRMRWAQCIRKIYLKDPMRCPSDGNPLRVVAFLSDPQVISRILKAVGFQDPPPPPAFPSPRLEALKNGGDASAGGRRFPGAASPIPGVPAGLRICTPRLALPAEDTPDFSPPGECYCVDGPSVDGFDDAPESLDTS